MHAFKIGVEPMGLIWSMSQEPGQKPGKRMMKSDVTTSLITHLYVLHGMIPPDECLSFIEDKNWLAYVTFGRLYMAEGVKRIEVRHGRLVGTLFIPAGGIQSKFIFGNQFHSGYI